jgi:hypothetical protein
MKDSVYLSTAYLAPIEYYFALLKFPRVFIDTGEHYIKQTYRNRCVIASANGPLQLTIPIIKPNDPHSYIRDVKISEHGKWQHLHWHAIMSAYSSSPYFEYYQDDFAPFYEKKIEYLIDFNEQLQELICKCIDFQPIQEFLPTFKKDFTINEIDFRCAISPGKELLLCRPYWQVFADKYGFCANLSIIDLLFNLGAESLLYLQDSTNFSDTELLRL